MAKRKASPSCAARGEKRTKGRLTPVFIWKPRDWQQKEVFTKEVSLVASRTNAERLVVKKVLRVDRTSGNDPRPSEIRTLALLPACNRVLKPIFFSADPDGIYGTTIFEYFPLGDLHLWRRAAFKNKGLKPVPESFIWRFFVQMTQALAFIQNKMGPGTENRCVILHRDIKPKNILVVHNGSTYPSFKLHDFGCATVYRRGKAGRQSLCGTFEWQPPENPLINTTAAEVWALGACVHYLAVGKAPIQDQLRFACRRFKELGRIPMSVRLYSSPEQYYAANVPREVTPINLSKSEQATRQSAQGVDEIENLRSHQYSDELDLWMNRCLRSSPRKRTTTVKLIKDMIPEGRKILRLIGGQAALTDFEIQFES